LLSDEIATRTSAGDIFFGLEISNGVKNRGAAMNPQSGLGRHRDMAPVIRWMFDNGYMPGYEAVPVPVRLEDGSEAEALLYQPAGTPAEVTEAHHYRTVAAVAPVGVTTTAAIPPTSPTPAALPSGTAPNRAAPLAGELSEDDSSTT
jgi:hypothetical protein